MKLLRQLYWRWWCYWSDVCFQHKIKKVYLTGYSLTRSCKRCWEEEFDFWYTKDQAKRYRKQLKFEQFKKENL
jgi:hypothetical protein